MTVTNVTPPVISGTTRVGHTLTTTPGTWTSDDPLTYSYQWERCDSLGANCMDIGGATSTAYVLTNADVGSTLRSEVTATENPVNPNFGTSLPARLATSAGSTVNVATTSALQTALTNSANGSIINITANLNGGGSTLNISRTASAAAPITITSDPGVVLSNFNTIYVGAGGYLRFSGLEIAGAAIDNIKITGSAHDIEIVGCEIRDAAGQGILVSSGASNIQIWNCVIHENGSNSTLDHGIYFAYASGACVIANCLFYENWAYNVQLYPNAPNLIYTCCTVDGGGPGGRGGTVIGSESNQTTNTKTIGNIGTDASLYAIRCLHPGSGNNVYDSLGFGNGSGDFEACSGITYTNCVHANPLYVNSAARDYHLQGGSPAIDHVDPSRYGYVPALDIEGTPRVTADAGCYAA